jgi:hypothetical protein
MLAVAGCGGDSSSSGGDVCPTGETKGPDGRCRPEPSGCPAGTSEEDGNCAPPGCPPGTWLVDDSCVAAGASGACAPGEHLAADGCRPAGVAPEDCPAGFVAAELGCEPVLPSEDCPVGEMAFLGDTDCHAVATCGSTTWGDIPVEATTQYVDGSFMGVSDGSASAPWTTLQEAVDAAVPGAIVALAAGTYDQVSIANQPVRLWGRCPSMVAVTAGPTELAIVVKDGADGTELRNLAVINAAAGVVVANVDDVIATQLWIHDVGLGVLATTFGGIGRIVLRDSLIEDTSESAAVANGGGLVVERLHARRNGAPGAIMALELVESANSNEVYAVGEVELRDSIVQDAVDSGFIATGGRASIEASAFLGVTTGPFGPGVGIGAAPDMASQLRAEVSVDGAYVARATGAGIAAGGAIIDVVDTTVVDTQPYLVNDSGHGMHFSVELDTIGTDATVRSSFIDNCIASGLLMADGTTEIDGLVVRGTKPIETGPSIGNLGVGVQVRRVVDDPAATEGWLRGSLLEDNHSAGVLVIDAIAHVEDTLIRNTKPDAFGTGIGIAGRSVVGPALALEVSGSRVEGSVGAGIFAAGITLDVQRSEVLDTTLAVGAVKAGSGIMIKHDGSAVPSQATLRLVHVSNSRDVGISVFGSSVVVEGTTVSSSLADDDGRFGDGILVSADILPAQLTLDGLLVQDSDRAAIANFGSLTRYARSWLSCQTYDLDGESSPLGGFVFEDLGANVAGCGVLTDECIVVTAELEAPTSLDLE